jgi:hypothetical protein
MNTDLLPLIIRFNDALNARDVDAMMALMTADCVFENTTPRQRTRYTKSAVRILEDLPGSGKPHGIRNSSGRTIAP